MPEGTQTIIAQNPAKRFAVDFIERNREALGRVSDAIFYFGELGMQEKRSAGLMTVAARRAWLRVERGISGFPTSFLATYGSGAPVIAIHTEYDANPSNSQKPGVAERAEIVPGAPGHCEGHNVNAAVMVVCGAGAAPRDGAASSFAARLRSSARRPRSNCSAGRISCATAISTMSTSRSTTTSSTVFKYRLRPDPERRHLRRFHLPRRVGACRGLALEGA